MGFTTVPEALRAAGRAGQTAVDGLAGADCGGPVEGVAGAMPGSRSAGAAGAFSSTWTATFTAWRDEAGGHVAALGTAADTYGTADSNAAESIPGGPI
ncbi:hypothetical protein [Amycolatopsis suaedae]|uniref:hypothetical protein n=1 Tax=Amycolatopsis suaedae TaxID=2510978 RepID=UPI0013EEF9BC|nr:hypothetical protein [Amycolatopsis suaedae]